MQLVRNCTFGWRMVVPVGVVFPVSITLIPTSVCTPVDTGPMHRYMERASMLLLCELMATFKPSNNVDSNLVVSSSHRIVK